MLLEIKKYIAIYNYLIYNVYHEIVKSVIQFGTQNVCLFNMIYNVSHFSSDGIET